MSATRKSNASTGARGLAASVLLHLVIIAFLPSVKDAEDSSKRQAIITLDLEPAPPVLVPVAAVTPPAPVAVQRLAPLPAARPTSTSATRRVGESLRAGRLELGLKPAGADAFVAPSVVTSAEPTASARKIVDLIPRAEDFAGIPTVIAKMKLNAGKLYEEDPDEGKLAQQKYPLKAAANGDLVHQDETMIARIKKDGRLTFKDRPNLRGELFPDFGDTINAARKDPWLLLKGRTGSEKGGLKIVKGQFDLTDALMRSVGEDPYAYNKRCFARATQKLRVKMRRADHHSKLDGALVQMAGQLARMWNDPQLSKRRLRGLLFELWDECQDGAPDPADALARKRLVVAQRVRWMISCFIRKHLPEGSHHAYSPRELRRMNQGRASTKPFAPYGSISPPC